MRYIERQLFVLVIINLVLKQTDSLRKMYQSMLDFLEKVSNLLEYSIIGSSMNLCMKCPTGMAADIEHIANAS